MREGVHGVFTPKMMESSSNNMDRNVSRKVLETKSLDYTSSKTSPGFRGRPLVSCIMFSVSVCEYCSSIEGWIYSKRRNRVNGHHVEYYTGPGDLKVTRSNGP